MNNFRTFHELLEEVGSSFNSKLMMSSRDHRGRWRPLSTAVFVEETKRLSLGLSEIGVKKGDSVGIMGHPSPLWLMADLAVMSIGAVTVPVFPGEPDDVRAYKIKDADIDSMFLLDETAVHEIEPQLKLLSLVVPVEDEVRVEKGSNTVVAPLSKLIGDGEKIEREKPLLFAELGTNVFEDDLSTIYYTSGSTGNPKGVELTHGNIISQLYSAAERVPLTESDRALSCLPLAHSFERFLVYYYISRGVPVHFNSDIHNLAEDFKEVSPTVTAVVPRILEKVFDGFTKKLAEKPPLARRIGRMAVEWALNREPGPGSYGWRGMLADWLVFSKLRTALGGGLRAVMAGGAAMPPDLNRFYINAGVPVYEGYGMTEASPVLSTNSSSAQRIGTVGPAFPQVDVRISDKGEVIARGPNIMRGYHNRPDETAAALDEDGWLHTGDLGEIDSDGFLKLTGRVKELFKTSCGEYVSPVSIEQKLTASPMIEAAMIIGEGRPYVTCLLFTPADRIPDSSDADEISRYVDLVNDSLEHWEEIRDYRVIGDELSTESGLLTPTMKIRRHKVMEEYKDRVEEMYADSGKPNESE